jgi:hypothetical protein
MFCQTQQFRQYKEPNLFSLQLAANGFTNIDGLDSSSGMLKVCMKTGHYNNLYEEYCGYNTLPIQDGTMFICSVLYRPLEV